MNAFHQIKRPGSRHARFRAVLGFLAALASGHPPAQAAVTEAWVQRYNTVMSGAGDYSAKAVRDAAGNIIVTGITDDGSPDAGTDTDMLTIKYSGAAGSVLWQRRYNGLANSNDFAKALTVDSSGNVIVLGSSDNGVMNDEFDYYTAKYAAADGALLWEKRYNGPANSNDIARAVAMDGSGNVVVTGTTATVKHAAADGALLWEKSGGGMAVTVDGTGNVVVTGTTATVKYAAADGALLWEKSGGGMAVTVDGTSNVVVTGGFTTVKHAAADGALLWEKANGGDTSALALDGSGNVVVTGSSGNGSDSDYYTAKYAAADGALLWEKRYNGTENGRDFARGIAVDGSGDVIVTGTSNAQYDDEDGGYFGGACHTIKYAAADGALLWEKPGPANNAEEDDYGTSVAVDSNGNVVVSGISSNGTSYDYYTAKYAAATGMLLWEQRYDSPRDSADAATAVAVDANGNVVVTGSSQGSGSGLDYYTAKYAATTGALLWEKRYNGPANADDAATAVAVDASGNVVVTGSSRGSGSGLDYYTAKYAAADGALLWEKRYNGPANRDDYVRVVALDASGNVVVTGVSNNGGDYTDISFYTAKYAAANGTLLWEKRYNGPAIGADQATALAVDGSGNVVVTGSSNNGTDAHGIGYYDNDYYTAKYAAADGALLWEKRYNGPSKYNDFATAAAVDAHGNVVVSGSSFGDFLASGDVNYDYYTAKYAAADGALLWEKRHNGPANTDDNVSAVAVDGSGNVVVTGTSRNPPNNYSYTAKYAAADGVLLWEQSSYIGVAAFVPPPALAVDGGGNVVVTGTSYNGPNKDYYTAKYAAADGALLWEQRYNAPAKGDDFANGLALGPNGMVAVTGSSSGDYATVVYRELPPPASFAEWAACYPLTGAAAAANADPDNDGLPNGVEYILGEIPTTPGTTGRPTVTIGGGNLVFTFSRDDESETPDVTLTVETGTTLIAWLTVFTIGPNTAASSPGVNVAENGAAPDTIIVTIAQGVGTVMFARLKVTIAP